MGRRKREKMRKEKRKKAAKRRQQRIDRVGRKKREIGPGDLKEIVLTRLAMLEELDGFLEELDDACQFMNLVLPVPRERAPERFLAPLRMAVALTGGLNDPRMPKLVRQWRSSVLHPSVNGLLELIEEESFLVPLEWSPGSSEASLAALDMEFGGIDPWVGVDGHEISPKPEGGCLAVLVLTPMGTAAVRLFDYRTLSDPNMGLLIEHYRHAVLASLAMYTERGATRDQSVLFQVLQEQGPLLLDLFVALVFGIPLEQSSRSADFRALLHAGAEALQDYYDPHVARCVAQLYEESHEPPFTVALLMATTGSEREEILDALESTIDEFLVINRLGVDELLPFQVLVPYGFEPDGLVRGFDPALELRRPLRDLLLPTHHPIVDELSLNAPISAVTETLLQKLPDPEREVFEEARTWLLREAQARHWIRLDQMQPPRGAAAQRDFYSMILCPLFYFYSPLFAGIPLIQLGSMRESTLTRIAKALSVPVSELTFEHLPAEGHDLLALPGVGTKSLKELVDLLLVAATNWRQTVNAGDLNHQRGDTMELGEGLDELAEALQWLAADKLH